MCKSIYAYDAFGRRIKRQFIDYINTSNSYGRLYFYDRDHIVEERDLDLNITSRYLHGSGVDDPLLLINKEGVFAYTKDGLGSVTELTPINTSSQVPYQRYRYSSYGVTSQMLEGITQGRKLIENRYAYTGREIEDEVGLYYYRARYYDPELGRFISEDPIGFSGGDVNFYGYVGNSPVMYVDPSGLYVHIPVAAIVGAVVGGVTGFVIQYRLNPKSSVKEYARAISASATITAGSAALAASGAGLIVGAATQLAGMGFAFLSSPLDSGTNSKDWYQGASTLLGSEVEKEQQKSCGGASE